MITDLHAHLWPAAFVEALQARSRSPRLDGWTLVLEDASWALDPAGHDVQARAEQAAVAGLDRICVSPSAALGIDRLPADEAAALAAVWLNAALDLPAPFRPWAVAGLVDPDPFALRHALDRGAVGLELAADALAAPGALDRLAPLLDVLDAAGAPLLVHPGPPPAAAPRPPWWGPVVSDAAALHAAWWAWADGGRARFPHLPVCFAALAGLAPLHGERHRSHDGRGGAIDPLTFLETSSYGPRAVDAVIRVLGIDVVCHGSDAPHLAPADLRLDPSATHALRSRNPGRLLTHAPQEVLA